MKKILLFMLPIMALSLASCERWMDDSPIIQFKDPYFLEVALNGGCDGDGHSTGETKVDKNGDGQISEKEASVAKGLCLSFGARIRNLDEIKYFTALEYLDCSDNQLTSLDLSNNTALTNLRCGYNQLTSLDLSNNTALTNLDCGYNQLTSLDLSKNTALTDLYCYGNQLTSLDLSNNTALTNLRCGNNQLTSLDLSNNTALTNLRCGNNQLTSLDLSNNTALTNLRCGNNPLQKLILYKYHLVEYDLMFDIESEYGDIIEYME